MFKYDVPKFIISYIRVNAASLNVICHKLLVFRWQKRLLQLITAVKLIKAIPVEETFHYIWP